MIIVAIVALSAVVLLAVASALGALPSYPTSVVTYANMFLTYLGQGMGFVWNFVHPAPVKAMLAFTLAVIGVYEGYKLVMWVAKKIPMFGVSD